MTGEQERLLVVDDEEAIRRLLHQRLSSEGYLFQEAVSFKMRMIGLLVDTARYFRPIPLASKAGDMLKQMVLTPIGFKDPKQLAVLFFYKMTRDLQRRLPSSTRYNRLLTVKQ